MRILNGRAAWRIHERASSALLIDGRDYYRAFYEAASTAKRSILLLGWQFDSDFALLRGFDLPPGAGPEEVIFLKFLDGLCRSRPELEVRILAWDHSFVFALERELLQKLVFDVATNERFHFKTDDTVPIGGSHHQKVAIIDGRIAFLGSQDLCQERWDDSAHLGDNPLRVARDAPYKPYHEVQACVTGLPARSLVELFVKRWHDATGEELDPASLIAPRGATADEIDVPVTLPMPPATIGLSRIVPEIEGREAAHEIRHLLTNAIADADRLIYIETQYLTACSVRDALIARMKERSRPKLDIVVMLPRKPEKFKEEVTIGPPQATMLEHLALEARANGHAFGVYNVASPSSGDDEVEQFVYIHAKLMIVDDRFMTVGSANFTNRSMTIDSELNISWEGNDPALRAAIRQARVRLLLEHTAGALPLRALVRGPGLVERLNAVAKTGTSRLRHHPLEHEEPSAIARAVTDLACEYLDPEPTSRSSAA